MDISVYVIAAGAFAYAVKIYVIDPVKIEKNDASSTAKHEEESKKNAPGFLRDARGEKVLAI